LCFSGETACDFIHFVFLSAGVCVLASTARRARDNTSRRAYVCVSTFCKCVYEGA
jgi:hypothetical protein